MTPERRTVAWGKGYRRADADNCVFQHTLPGMSIDRLWGIGLYVGQECGETADNKYSVTAERRSETVGQTSILKPSLNLRHRRNHHEGSVQVELRVQRPPENIAELPELNAVRCTAPSEWVQEPDPPRGLAARVRVERPPRGP